MKHLFLSLALLCLLASCTSESGDNAETADSLNVMSREDSLQAKHAMLDSAVKEAMKNTLEMPDTLGRFFDKYGVKGAFVLFDPQKGAYFYHNIERTSEPLVPASTFKILHALIALETGALADTSTILEWDGKKREIEAWNQNQTLRSAIQNSTVWAFQELARRIGQKRMQHYINLVGYGNKDIGGKIDSFWLDGKLRISMQEQILFLRQLYREELPFSNKTMRAVKSMIVNTENEHYTISGKTGWSQASKPELGWYIGYIIINPKEEGDLPRGYYFATTIDIVKPEDAEARKAITFDILKHVKLM